MDLLYITFDKLSLSGFIVVDQNLPTPGLKDSFMISNIKFSVGKAQASDLKSFWDKHGNHYNGILKKMKQTTDAK
jgi:hypothetical protein